MDKRLEEMALNAWPALHTTLLDGWLLRSANGYTKRSNSVSAIYQGTLHSFDAKIRWSEEYYAQLGQKTIFKITPFVPEGLDQDLEKRGYAIANPSLVMELDSLDTLEEPTMHDIQIEESLSETWLDVIARLQQLTDNQRDTTRQLLNNRPLRQGFFLLYNNGVPVAGGIAVVEGDYIGLYDIVTEQTARNRGYGMQLLLQMLRWGKLQGASRSYILVVQNNVPALHLYEKLQYKEVYRYWYRWHETHGLHGGAL